MALHSTKHQNSIAGFTLLEVLAVVVIIGVLAAIAAPSWIAYANRQRIRAVQSDLVQVLKQAQQQAIRERGNVTVTIQDTLDVPTVDTDGFVEVLGPDDLPAGAVIVDALAPGAGTPQSVNSVQFDYQGSVVGQEVPIVVKINPKDSTAQQCVVVATILGSIKTDQDAACDNIVL